MQLDFHFDSSNSSYFIVSIHEKDQFMPGYAKLFGSTFVLEPAAKDGVVSVADYILDLTVTTYLNRPQSPCHSTDSYYPLSQCIDKYVVAKLKCRYVNSVKF